VTCCESQHIHIEARHVDDENGEADDHE
jgi:hypothetical protein